MSRFQLIPQKMSKTAKEKHITSKNIIIYFLLSSYFFGLTSINAESFKSAVSAEYPQGFHTKIINYIGQEMALTPDIIYAPLARRIHMLSTGQLDLLIGIRKTPEREKLFIFIEPGYTRGTAVSGLYINTQKNSFLDNAANSRKKIIAVTTNSSYIKDYDLPFSYKVITVTSLVQVIKMLDVGRIDAFIYGKKSANILVNKMELNHLKPSLKFTPTKNTNKSSYIAISKHSKLKSDIDKLSQISTKILQEKYKKIHDAQYKKTN